MALPGLTLASPSVLVIARLAPAVTVSVSEAVLSEVFESVNHDGTATLAVFVMLPLAEFETVPETV